MNTIRLVSLIILSSLLLNACSSKSPPSNQSGIEKQMSPNAGRYQQDSDSKPDRLPTLLEMTDPTPNAEPLSRGGNKPYNIFGIDYLPMAQATEHEEIGIASWYGNKFHGHYTSNGETYNMFAMTAAHKTLPLPSYVRVTNLDTKQSAIVRVNDRGPFHQDRVIDLSYSAAYKIGMLQRGTARVKLELLKSPAMLAQQSSSAISTGVVLNRQCYIQLFASSDNKKATQLQQQVAKQWSVPTEVRAGNGLYRLLVGPTADLQLAQNWLNRFRSASYPEAFFIDGRQCG
ncbi:septal ring lytic transglycosylase RlpA family protein [Alishewanella sp. 16-MA]|uniref:Endolytic peptidoglycan transglycosylase RlpA n=1 Tax=Alishewanella maricola TaxID=2795740 RepID=A0ABS8C4A2_9ALTE|nr:septal ring lytic transglycosylase RlpA family protein [Alishewanella maricola]MCB5227168.1 septal ring lytic transglycosylase RlpA family protein [Alishewanella maricola]